LVLGYRILDFRFWILARPGAIRTAVWVRDFGLMDGGHFLDDLTERSDFHQSTINNLQSPIFNLQ